MKKNKLLYIIPRMSFFSQGYRGRVMRALGTCEGFAHNGWDVTVVGGNQLKNFRDDLPSSVKIIEINEPGGFLKFFFLVDESIHNFP